MRVVTLTDMTRTVTAPLVHIRKLESKAGVRPGTVLQQNGDNVDMSRSFSDPRADLATRWGTARLLELQTKVKRRIKKISQSQRRHYTNQPARSF